MPTIRCALILCVFNSAESRQDPFGNAHVAHKWLDVSWVDPEQFSIIVVTGTKAGHECISILAHFEIMAFLIHSEGAFAFASFSSHLSRTRVSCHHSRRHFGV